ncbi:hypothetical protein EYF80_022998 [Liparis tanakae]|uniref:Uncharacterized protein n=1 Tax=Liparis tanakae TaxID=230148 RepID=A0A4Z2HLP9_9TELE|nr:hypothetical protein EYF80_022998 [Liparis tanakae]
MEYDKHSTKQPDHMTQAVTATRRVASGGAEKIPSFHVAVATRGCVQKPVAMDTEDGCAP